jgi:hypothetical protein
MKSLCEQGRLMELRAKRKRRELKKLHRKRKPRSVWCVSGGLCSGVALGRHHYGK